MSSAPEIQKHKLFIDVRPASGLTGGVGIVQPDNSISLSPAGDFFINVELGRSQEVFEYIDTQKDETIVKIERQNINPEFIEFGFFDTINRNKANNGADLSIGMIQFIRDRRADVFTSSSTDQEVKNWFDITGRLELPWNVAGVKTTIDDIDKSAITLGHIVSKAQIFPITINS